MSDLAIYDRMCFAIAECHRVDEVKNLRDKAQALELYARQCKNTEAERQAANVRLRAERRTGELLSELARATPQTANPTGVKREPVSNAATRVAASPYSEALQSTGISRQSANRYEALAAVPTAQFEEALRDTSVKPTTTRLIQQARDPQPQIDAAALWIWGRMRDFERDGFHAKNPHLLLSQMTETMRADAARIAPLMAEFFNAMEEATHELA